MSVSTGTIYVKVNAELFEFKPGVKVKLGLPTREPQVAAGVAGRHFIVKPEPSMVSGTLLHRAESPDLDAMASWENVSILVETDSGVFFAIDGAYVSNSPELSDEGGGVNIEFTGPSARQI